MQVLLQKSFLVITVLCCAILANAEPKSRRRYENRLSYSGKSRNKESGNEFSEPIVDPKLNAKISSPKPPANISLIICTHSHATYWQLLQSYTETIVNQRKNDAGLKNEKVSEYNFGPSVYEGTMYLRTIAENYTQDLRTWLESIKAKGEIPKIAGPIGLSLLNELTWCIKVNGVEGEGVAKLVNDTLTKFPNIKKIMESIEEEKLPSEGENSTKHVIQQELKTILLKSKPSAMLRSIMVCFRLDHEYKSIRESYIANVTTSRINSVPNSLMNPNSYGPSRYDVIRYLKTEIIDNDTGPLTEFIKGLSYSSIELENMWKYSDLIYEKDCIIIRRVTVQFVMDLPGKFPQIQTINRFLGKHGRSDGADDEQADSMISDNTTVIPGENERD